MQGLALTVLQMHSKPVSPMLQRRVNTNLPDLSQQKGSISNSAVAPVQHPQGVSGTDIRPIPRRTLLLTGTNASNGRSESPHSRSSPALTPPMSFPLGGVTHFNTLLYLSRQKEGAISINASGKPLINKSLNSSPLASARKCLFPPQSLIKWSRKQDERRKRRELPRWTADCVRAPFLQQP